MSNTVKIMIDFKRAATVGASAGNIDAEVVRSFIDDKGRDMLAVQINGHEFNIVASSVIKSGPAMEWAEPTGYVDMRTIARGQSYNQGR